MLYRSRKIYVDDSPIHGRGVFASELIKKDEIIEECHHIIVPASKYTPILHEHFFSWPKGNSNQFSICLGFGSIFNHSDEAFNADWETDVTNNKFIFFATRNILPGEEICTNYKRS